MIDDLLTMSEIIQMVTDVRTKDASFIQKFAEFMPAYCQMEQELQRCGRDIAMDEQGRFTDEGYARVASERWDGQFDGELEIFPTNTGSPAQGKPPSVTAPSPFSLLSRERSLM